jgi:hypothetical protein
MSPQFQSKRYKEVLVEHRVQAMITALLPFTIEGIENFTAVDRAFVKDYLDKHPGLVEEVNQERAQLRIKLGFTGSTREDFEDWYRKRFPDRPLIEGHLGWRIREHDKEITKPGTNRITRWIGKTFYCEHCPWFFYMSIHINRHGVPFPGELAVVYARFYYHEHSDHPELFE